MASVEGALHEESPTFGRVKKDTSLTLGIKGDFPLDQAVLKVLPEGTTVISAQAGGASACPITGRMDTILAGGEPKSYFIKISTGALGESMMKGEFTAITEILKYTPDFAPVAHTWGKYESSDTYFLLSDYFDMDLHVESLPDADEFCSKLAELHRNTSPNGKFGFYTTTYHGIFPRWDDGWYDSWTDFMVNTVTQLIAFDKANTGEWPELEAVGEHCIKYVIPRLIGALESNGRSIEPCLIHGDLWEGNIGTRKDTGDLVIYDSGAFYAHHEFELGHWRPQRHRISSKLFRETYLKYFPADAPVEEFDDRNRLYALGSHIVYAVQVPGSIDRSVAYNDLCYLCEKYAPKEGLGKYDPAKDPSVNMK